MPVSSSRSVIAQLGELTILFAPFEPAGVTRPRRCDHLDEVEEAIITAGKDRVAGMGRDRPDPGLHGDCYREGGPAVRSQTTTVPSWPPLTRKQPPRGLSPNAHTGAV
jgi:hypothetical protein